MLYLCTMKIEFNWTIDDVLLGILICSGEDEDGSFQMLSIGLLVCEVNFMKYL